MPILPATEFVNQLPDIEKAVGSGQMVVLTQDGYGRFLVVDYDRYYPVIDGYDTEIDRMLDEAECEALHEQEKDLMTLEEVHSRILGHYHE